MKISDVAAAFKTLEALGVPLMLEQVEACRDHILKEIGLSKEQMLRLLHPQKIDPSAQRDDAQKVAILAELHEMQSFIEQAGGKVGTASVAMGHDRQWISDSVPRVLQKHPWLRRVQSLQPLIIAIEGNKAAKKQ